MRQLPRRWWLWPANPLMRFQLWCQNMEATDFHNFSQFPWNIDSFHITAFPFIFPAVKLPSGWVSLEHGWWSGRNSHQAAGLWSALRCPTPKICDFASCLQWTFALIEMSKPRINFWCRALLMLPTTPVCAGRQDKSWLISAKYFQQRQRNVYLSFFYFHPYSTKK